MNKFSFQSLVNLNIRKVFDWHKNTFALERLTPPWDLVNVSKRHYINSYPLINGGTIEIKQKVFPLINLKFFKKALPNMSQPSDLFSFFKTSCRMRLNIVKRI